MSNNTTPMGDELTEKDYQSDYQLCMDLATEYIRLDLELQALKKTSPKSPMHPLAIDGYEEFVSYTREKSQHLKDKLAHRAKYKDIETQLQSAMNLVAKHLLDGIWFAVDYNGKKYAMKVNNLVTNKVEYHLWDRVMVVVK